MMLANAGNSQRGAISSLDCPPIVAVEHCREHLVCLVRIEVLFFFQVMHGCTMISVYENKFILS